MGICYLQVFLLASGLQEGEGELRGNCRHEDMLFASFVVSEKCIKYFA